MERAIATNGGLLAGVNASGRHGRVDREWACKFCPNSDGQCDANDSNQSRVRGSYYERERTVKDGTTTNATNIMNRPTLNQISN